MFTFLYFRQQSYRLILALTLVLIIPSAQSITVPSGVARPIARGGAQILSKLRFGSLRNNLNKIYKRDEWLDAFDFVDLYKQYQEKNAVPPELQRLSSTAKAANNGDPIAQRTLGVAYQQGNKVNRDFKKASYWYSRAVEEKDGLSMIFLGRMFKRGIGVQRNTVGAYCLFSLAANHGQSQVAQNELQALKRRMSKAQMNETLTCMK